MANRDWKFWVKYTLSLALAAAIIVALVYWMNIPKLIRSLKEVAVAPVILACVLNVFVMLSKGVRWYFIGASSSSISVWQAVRLTILSFFINSFIPARGGDVIRGLAAARETRSSKVTSLASVGLDKLMDMITVFFLAAGFPFLPNLPGWVKKGTVISLALAYSLLILVLVIAVKGRNFIRGREPSRFFRLVDKIASGFDSAARPGIFFLAVALSLLSYGFQMGMVYLCSLSTGARLSLPEVACALLALNIAVSVPLTPLNVGTLHAAFVAVLLFFGFDKEPAMTSAIALHLAYILPLFAIAPFLGHRTLLKQIQL
jgi:uncharacterized protein (TIRG00374 family)